MREDDAGAERELRETIRIEPGHRDAHILLDRLLDKCEERKKAHEQAKARARRKKAEARKEKRMKERECKRKAEEAARQAMEADERQLADEVIIPCNAWIRCMDSCM